MLRKIFCIAFLGLVVMLLIFSTAEASNVKLQFWFSLPHDQALLMDSIVNDFNQTHKHYLVTTKNFKTPAELKKALFTTKNPPSVAIIDTTWQKDLVDQGKLIAVEDLIEQVGSTLRVVLKMDTFPSLWASCVYRGKAQTLPYYTLSRALFYNPKEISRPPRTWIELIKVGKKNTKGDQWAFWFSDDESHEELGKNFHILLWQLDSDVYDAHSKKVLLNNSKGLKALELWHSFVHKHKISPKSSVNIEKLVMFIGTNEDFLRYKKQGHNFKVTSLPRFKSSINFLDLRSLAIFKQKNTDPAKSWYFVYWISEFPRALKWSLNTPYLPANKQVTLSPEYFEHLEKFPEIRVFLKGLYKAKIGPEVAHSDIVLRVLGEKIILALEGKLSPKEALHQASESIKKLLQ